MDDRDGPPWVAVPERLDRPLRLGPFASGRDLLKFLAAAAAGSVVALAVAPWLGLALVTVGAVVALWRPDGEPLDERLAMLLRWTARQSRRRGAMTPPPLAAGPPVARSVVSSGDGRPVAILRAGGVPLAFLPPADLARQFDLYRTLLRSLDLPFALHASTATIFTEAIVPQETGGTEPERGPREGYAELVRLISRRRAVRRVHFALYGPDRTAEGRARLETAVSLATARLQELGAPVERLRGRTLLEAARRTGLVGTRRAS